VACDAAARAAIENSLQRGASVRCENGDVHTSTRALRPP
jgi:hypothetical protein